MPNITSSTQELLEAMLNIENTSHTVENIRSTSLAMRKLSTMCSSENDDLLIAFCFGLLTANFAPLWSDACNALKVVAERSGAKVWGMAFSYLASEINEESENVEKQVTPNLKYEAFAEKVWSEGQLDLYSRLQSLYDTVLLPLTKTDMIGHC